MAVLNSMNNDLLRYYLRGYGLSPEGNQPVLRKRLSIFLGFPEDYIHRFYGATEFEEYVLFGEQH